MRPMAKAIGAMIFVAGLGACSIGSRSSTAAVQSAVRDYFEALNRADPTAIMEMFSKDPEATSVMEGDILRGWEAIRLETDKVAGTAGEYHWAPGTMEVVPLGRDHALVVVPVNITHKSGLGREELAGASTLVLEQKDGKWKVLHEHHSIQPEEPENDHDSRRS